MKLSILLVCFWNLGLSSFKCHGAFPLGFDNMLLHSLKFKVLQKWDKKVAPSQFALGCIEPMSPLVFKYAINRTCSGDLYLWLKGGS